VYGKLDLEFPKAKIFMKKRNIATFDLIFFFAAAAASKLRPSYPGIPALGSSVIDYLGSSGPALIDSDIAATKFRSRFNSCSHFCLFVLLFVVLCMMSSMRFILSIHPSI